MNYYYVSINKKLKFNTYEEDLFMLLTIINILELIGEPLIEIYYKEQQVMSFTL